MSRELTILGWTGAVLLAVTAAFAVVARPAERAPPRPSAFVVLAGQSNAVGFGLTSRDLPPAATAADPHVMIWHGAAFAPMQPGVNTGSPGAPYAWGPEVEFARRWRADHPDGVLYIVKHARGSTGLAADAMRPDWSPGSQELYAEAQVQVAHAKAALEAEHLPSTVNVILWMQGEQDAVEADKAPAYGVNLINLFAAMRRDWADPETPIIFGQINGRSGFELGEIVRTSQLQVDEGDPQADMAATDGLALQSDRVHLSASGQIGLGDAFYALYSKR